MSFIDYGYLGKLQSLVFSGYHRMQFYLIHRRLVQFGPHVAISQALEVPGEFQVLLVHPEMVVLQCSHLALRVII